MTRTKFVNGHSGAGYTEEHRALHAEVEGKFGQWYYVTPSWLVKPEPYSNGMEGYDPLPFWWREAIEKPKTMIEYEVKYGNGSGSLHIHFAYYDPARGQVFANEMECPNKSSHHLYQTCQTCRQYG